MDKSENKKKVGRPSLEGKKRHLIMSDAELKEVKQLLKEIRNKAKTNKTK